jgi:hypothetical protein
MKFKLLYLQCAAFVFLLLSPTAGRADTLTIGYISFDSGVVDGENSFDLYNFTGGLLEPGADLVADDLLFSGVLTYDDGGTTHTVDFSNVDVDGGSPTTIASVLSTDDILSASLALTLSNSTGVNIYDDGGNATIANLQSVPNTPLAGPLVACDGSGSYPCSNAIVTVDTAAAGIPPTVPEPSSWMLLGTGLLGMVLMFKLRFRPN